MSCPAGETEPKAEWREQWAGAVHSPDDLVRFVDAVGCCTKSEVPRYPHLLVKEST